MKCFMDHVHLPPGPLPTAWSYQYLHKSSPDKVEGTQSWEKSTSDGCQSWHTTVQNHLQGGGFPDTNSRTDSLSNDKQNQIRQLDSAEILLTYLKGAKIGFQARLGHFSSERSRFRTTGKILMAAHARHYLSHSTDWDTLQTLTSMTAKSVFT